MSSVVSQVLVDTRRREVRTDPVGSLRVRLAVRNETGTHALRVRDVSVVGLGLTGPKALPVSLGEPVLLLIDFDREPIIRGAMVRGWVRRRRPDREGWFVGVETINLRDTPWWHIADWIDQKISAGG